LIELWVSFWDSENIGLKIFSSNAVIVNNSLVDNHYGMKLDWSSNNTIKGNLIENNSDNRFGILFEESSNNNIADNIITSKEGIIL
jgi:parallel beta-helix repeat protein